MVEARKSFPVLAPEPIVFDLPPINKETSSETRKIVRSLLVSVEGGNDAKKEEMHNLFKTAIKELSDNICSALKSKLAAASKHYENKKFLQREGLFDNLIKINENIDRVQDSLNLLRYFKYDKPASYATGMVEDFKRVSTCLTQLNNFIYSFIYKNSTGLQVNPLKIIELLFDADSILSNFDENFILLPSEYKPAQLEYDVLLDESTYTEIKVPSEQESERLRSVILEQINKTFEKFDGLFDEDSMYQIVNWQEIDACLDGGQDEEQPVIEEKSDKHKGREGLSNTEGSRVKDLMNTIDKLSHKESDESSSSQHARAYITRKLKTYIEKLYESFLSQVKTHQYKRINNLDEYIKKLVLEFSFDNQNYTEKALQVITDDMVNYFFSKRITLNPLLNKIEGIEHYFAQDLVEFKLIEADKIIVVSLQTYILEFLKSVDTDKMKFIQRNVIKRYSCIVSSTKVDFILLEYNYSAPGDGINIYLTNSTIEPQLYQAFAEVTPYMPATIKCKFQIYDLEFIEPRFKLDYKQVWLNYYAPSTTSDFITDLFKLLVYATVYTLHNHLYTRPEKHITMDSKYFFFFSNQYLDYQECYSNPLQNTWSDLFPFGGVPFPFRRPQARTPRKSIKDFLFPTQSTPVTVPEAKIIEKNISAVQQTPMFETTFFWRDVRPEESQQLIDRLVETEVLHFDGPQFLQDFVRFRSDKIGSVEVIPPKITGALWKRVKALVDNLESPEMLEPVQATSKANISFLTFAFDMYNPLLALTVNRRSKQIVFIIKEDAAESLWSESHVNTMRKSLEELFSRSFEDFTTAQVNCEFASEAIATIFKKFYFPSIFLINLVSFRKEFGVSETESVGITEEDVTQTFEKFMHLNVFIMNAEVYKAYYVFYQNLLKTEYTFFVSSGNWKMDEFIYVLKQVEHTLASGIPNVLMAFGFNSLRGNGIYYLVFSEKSNLSRRNSVLHPAIKPIEGKEEEEKKIEQKQEDVSKDSVKTETKSLVYHVEIFSLLSNQLDDDEQVIKSILKFCKFCQAIDLVCDSSTKLNASANLMLPYKLEETLMTLAYLKEASNMTNKQAFKVLASSNFAHYRELNQLLSHINLRTKFDSPKDGFKDTDIHDDSGEADNEEKKEQQNSDVKWSGVSDKVFIEDFIEDEQRREEVEQTLNTQSLDILQNGSLKNDTSNPLEWHLSLLNNQMMKSSTFYYTEKEKLGELLQEQESFASKLQNYCTNLVEQVMGGVKSKAPPNFSATNMFKVNIFMVLPFEQYEKYNNLAVISYSSQQETPFDLYYIKKDGGEGSNEDLDNKFKSLFQILNTSIKHKFAVTNGINHQAVAVSIDTQSEVLVKKSYDLIIFYLIHQVLNKKLENKDSSSLTELALTHKQLLILINQQSESIFKEKLGNLEMRKKYTELLKAFSQPGPLMKAPSLMSFSTTLLNINSVGNIGEVLFMIKKQFVDNSELVNYTFSFNVLFKGTVKHYFMLWNLEGKKYITVTMFTNSKGETDALVDRLVQSYIEQEHPQFNQQFCIKEIRMHRGQIKHRLHFEFLDLTTYILTYLICVKEMPSHEAFHRIAHSALLYNQVLEELANAIKDL